MKSRSLYILHFTKCSSLVCPLNFFLYLLSISFFKCWLVRWISRSLSVSLHSTSLPALNSLPHSLSVCLSFTLSLGNMHGLDHRKFDCTVMSQAVSLADWWGDGGTAFAVGTGRQRWQEGCQKLRETAVMHPGLLYAPLRSPWL